MDMQLYDYSKRIYSIEKNILEASHPDKNKELIFNFENMLYAERISNASVFRYGEKLKFGESFQKPLLPPIGWIAPKDS